MTSELENWLKQFQDVNYSEIVNYSVPNLILNILQNLNQIRYRML